MRISSRAASRQVFFIILFILISLRRYSLSLDYIVSRPVSLSNQYYTILVIYKLVVNSFVLLYLTLSAVHTPRAVLYSLISAQSSLLSDQSIISIVYTLALVYTSFLSMFYMPLSRLKSLVNLFILLLTDSVVVVSVFISGVPLGLVIYTYFLIAYLIVQNIPLPRNLNFIQRNYSSQLSRVIIGIRRPYLS